MSDVLVLAGAHTSDLRAYEPLKVSCEMFGVPLRIIGTEQPLNYGCTDPRLFLETIDETLDIVARAQESYIVITDAFDVIACRWDEVEVIETIQVANRGLLVSAEANCYPNGLWKAIYDRHFAGFPWRYANGGQYCGKREAVCWLLATFRARLREAVLGGATNEILHRMFAEDQDCFSLDVRCRVFQSMYTDAVRHLSAFHSGDSGSTWVRHPAMCNLKTRSYPMFLHFNGRAPGLPLWYERITGKTYHPHPGRPEYYSAGVTP